MCIQSVFFDIHGYFEILLFVILSVWDTPVQIPLPLLNSNGSLVRDLRKLNSYLMLFYYEIFYLKRIGRVHRKYSDLLISQTQISPSSFL